MRLIWVPSTQSAGKRDPAGITVIIVLFSEDAVLAHGLSTDRLLGSVPGPVLEVWFTISLILNEGQRGPQGSDYALQNLQR